MKLTTEERHEECKVDGIETDCTLDRGVADCPGSSKVEFSLDTQEPQSEVVIYSLGLEETEETTGKALMATAVGSADAIEAWLFEEPAEQDTNCNEIKGKVTTEHLEGTGIKGISGTQISGDKRRGLM